MPLQEIPSFRSKSTKTENTPSSSNSDGSGSSGTKIALRTEEEQQAAAREREERERAAMEKEIKDRKEARRKSLANRRVSFAAEATLHTFHEIEYMQDSTTSTDSTRRRSSAAAQSPAQTREVRADTDASGEPATSPDQVEETVGQSPEDQRHLHQRKRRRSSGITSDQNYDDPNDDTIASTVYDSDSDEGDDVTEVQTEASGSDSDSDNDGTMMTMEAEEMTSASLASTRYGANDGDTTSSLDGALREAARRAVNQTSEADEDEEVIPGFIGWGKNARQRQQQQQQQQAAIASQEEPPSETSLPSSSPLKFSPIKDVDDGTQMDMDMDMTNAIGGIIPLGIPFSPDPAEDMSMDVTHVFGGILKQQAEGSADDRVDDESVQGDQTMEFTTAMGAIQPTVSSDVGEDPHSDDEMSMELTTVMGGVLAAKNKQLQQSMQESSSPSRGPADSEGIAMDETMDITTAVGGILQSRSTPDDRTEARRLMEQEADQPESTTTMDAVSVGSPSKKISSGSAQLEESSPGLLAFQGKDLRRSNGPLFSATPKSAVPSPSSQRKTRSQGSASPTRSPSRSPVRSPARNPAQSPAQRTSRTPSPQRRQSSAHTSSSIGKATPILAKSPARSINSLFQRDSTLPLVVLTPQRPKLSGVGIDKSGIGSPRVTELLDRRGSIGDSAANFSPLPIPGQSKTVAFEDPKIIEEEIDRERRNDYDRESGRRILEKESDGVADERDATLNLKELIQGLSPKKNPLKGRKSLHVGSARGLLGKRPSELEDDSDADEQDGVKRLKGLQGSPVKNIRLQQPPSKAETTGSRAVINRDNIEHDNVTPSSMRSPQRATQVTTPKDQGRFRSVFDDQPSTTINFNATPSTNLMDLQPDDGEDRIHLQDFLNMTSIRFMELTTTKRRHTVMPSARKDSLSADRTENVSLEKCVVAGACTVPMLELYQHSCRELKKYISEGRRIVREIETETFAENPPLFREYISASPEFKTLMDNQFKNVKSHARLLSKAMWYEWRMKLQEGLREGLVKIAEGMTADEKLLDKEQKLLSSILPAMTKQFEALGRECSNLEAVASELEDCDLEELESARSDLLAVDDDIEAKTRETEELRRELQETEQNVDQLVERKQQCIAEIKAAEKVREECRGWSSAEISSLKSKVDALERQHGWAITGVSGTGVSMTYRREIELVFDSASFRAEQPNSRIDLWYVATSRDQKPLPLTPEKEFCLQCIRDHVRGLPQSQTKVGHMLRMVSAAWDRAAALANQVHQLNLTFPTSVTRTSDSSIAIKSSLLLAPLKTKVEVNMSVHGAANANGLDFVVSSQAVIVYGEQFNAAKMADFLSARISDHIHVKQEKETEFWCDVLSDLHARLLARGQK